MAADGYIEHKARTDRRDYRREEGANERTPPEIVQYTANYNPNLCSSAERLYPLRTQVFLLSRTTHQHS